MTLLSAAVLQTADAAEDAPQLPDPGPGHGGHLPAVAVAGEAVLSGECYLPPPSPQCAQQNYQSGLALTEAEWTAEWSSVLRLASPDPRTSSSCNNNNNNNNSGSSSKRRSRLSTVCEDTDNPLYESLEEVHVLVLAHVLRRPIIVVADTVLKVSSWLSLEPQID